VIWHPYAKERIMGNALAGRGTYGEGAWLGLENEVQNDEV
jgi:hypothetical protein